MKSTKKKQVMGGAASGERAMDPVIDPAQTNLHARGMKIARRAFRDYAETFRALARTDRSLR